MDTLKSNWVGWAEKDQCPLCNGIATIYKKGHSRGDGIILEDGISYCEQCANTPECDEHWGKTWKEMWEKQKNICEKNWQEHGVYTNVGGPHGPSFYFGYTKTSDGLKPYLEVYPDCPKFALERQLTKIQYTYKDPSSFKGCRQQIKLAIKESTADEAFKTLALKHSIGSIDRMDAWDWDVMGKVFNGNY